MYRYSMFLLLLVVSLFLTPLFSKVRAENPWEQIWAAIAELRTQITSISLLPGPIGPTGPTGP